MACFQNFRNYFKVDRLSGLYLDIMKFNDWNIICQEDQR